MAAFKLVGAVCVLSFVAHASDPTPADLRFEPNMGQTSPAVSFLSHWSRYTLFLTATGATLRAGGSVWKMSLVGARAEAEVVGVDLLEGQSHYLIGAPEEWHTGVPAYGRVEYRNVYPGVNLVYYGTRGRMQYDLVVNPGAEPSQIRLRFEGGESMWLDTEGTCGLPATAYSLNMTVVPSGSLGYLTTWPTGGSQPGVSTLNAYKGLGVANAALVPAGAGGAVNVYVTNTTQVIIDTNGYFGQ
jgi:hypothetical protein